MLSSLRISPNLMGGVPKWRSLFLWAGLSLSPSPIIAKTGCVDTLREAQVVAVRPLPSDAVPRHTLDSAQFMRLGATSLTEALHHLPGLNIRDYGGAGGLKTVSVRGMGATHTQVMVDGLPVSNAQQGAVDISRYALSELTGITLGMGEQPTLLCPVRALAAATLTLNTPQFQPNSSAEIGITQASWNTWQPHLTAYQKASRRTRLAETLGFDYASNNYPYSFAGESHRRHNSQFSSWHTQFRSRTQLRRGTLDGSLRYWGTNRHLPGPVIYYNPQSGTERLQEQESSSSLHWRSTANRSLQWQIAGRHTWQQSHYRNMAVTHIGPSIQDYDQHEFYTTAGLSYSLTPHWGVSYAADYAIQTLYSNLVTSSNARRHSLQQAFSLQYSHAMLHATLRLLDHYINNHVQARSAAASSQAALNVHRLTPAFSLSYRPCRPLWLRMHYKEFFRSPTFTESYYYHLGSPLLRPEATRQGGLGLAFQHEWRLFDVTATADGYCGQVRHRIVSIPYNLFLWRTVNKEMVHTAGLDASTRLSVRLQRHLITLTGNYSLQHAQAEGHQLPYTPRHTGATSLCWENPWMNTSLSLTAASRRSTTLTPSVASTILPRYHEMSLSLWHRFAVVRQSSSVTLRGDLLNLTNHHYVIIARYPMPGLSYRITITYQL